MHTYIYNQTMKNKKKSEIVQYYLSLLLYKYLFIFQVMLFISMIVMSNVIDLIMCGNKR